MLLAGAGAPLAGGDPRVGIDPPQFSPTSVRPFWHNEGLSGRRQKGQTAGPGLASFYIPSPKGKDWVRPGYLLEPNRSRRGRVVPSLREVLEPSVILH